MSCWHWHGNSLKACPLLWRSSSLLGTRLTSVADEDGRSPYRRTLPWRGSDEVITSQRCYPPVVTNRVIYDSNATHSDDPMITNPLLSMRLMSRDRLDAVAVSVLSRRINLTSWRFSGGRGLVHPNKQVLRDRARGIQLVDGLRASSSSRTRTNAVTNHYLSRPNLPFLRKKKATPFCSRKKDNIFPAFCNPCRHYTIKGT